MTTVVGIDPSLSATGLAVLTVSGERHTIETRRVSSTPTTGVRERAGRLAGIHAEVALTAHTADLAVIEGPALNMSNPGTWDRAGLWWLIISSLVRHDVPVAVCPPTTLKKYATGSGRADKADMRMAWFTRAGEDLRDDNQVDAGWLAVAGAARLGHDVLGMPVHNRTALEKVEWPEQLEQVGA